MACFYPRTDYYKASPCILGRVISNFSIILKFSVWHYLMAGYCLAQDKAGDKLCDEGNKKSSHEAVFETGAPCTSLERWAT